MESLVQVTASKFEKTTILKQLEKVHSEENLKIGFIGMFSAGKTSLINSLLNTHLPVNPAPTTKSICVIESSGDLTENAYFQESGMERTPISFGEFQDLLNGKEFGVAVTRIPCRDEMPQGLVYIDTPGVDNFSAQESDLTYRYLSLLDAAIVCIDINEGTIRQSLLDFISEPELAALSSRMFFVLTHSDLKMPDSVRLVEEEALQKIMKYSASNHFDTTDLKERIISVNATDHASSIKVVKLIKNFILSRQKGILEERVKKEEKELARRLSELLQDDVENLKCDMPELNDKKVRLQEEIQRIESEMEEHKTELDSLREKLSEQIKNILLAHELEVTTAGSTAEMQTVFGRINQEIADAAKILMNSLKDKIVIPAGAGNPGCDLLLKMKRIDNTKNLTVTAATAALTAWICPGTLAWNAAEGIAGAAVQTAGKAAQVASKTAQTAGKAAKAAGAAAGSSTFGNIMRGIGKIIHDINPLEMIGDWVAAEVKHHTYTSSVGVKSIQISNNMIDMIEEPFEQNIIVPLRNQYMERMNSLDALLKERKQGVRDFTSKKEALLAAIDELNIFANC